MVPDSLGGAPPGALKFKSGAIEFTVTALAVGADFFILVTGGDEAHIGAVSLADPHRPLEPALSISFSGHREEELTQIMAQSLAASWQRKVAVAAGMHWHGFNLQLLCQVRNAWQELIEFLQDTLN
jgi:hypothetical protein